MNRLFFAGVVSALLLSRTTASAANLVEFPTGPAAWIISATPSLSNPSPEKAKQSHIVKVESTQDGQRRRTVVSFSDGSQKERWDLPAEGIVLAQDSNGQAFASLAGRTAPGAIIAIAVPFTPSSFQWLTPSLLADKGPVQYQGKLCFHYKGPVNVGLPGNSHRFYSVQEAWIDSKTLLPVALDNGNDLGVFTFAATPPPPLTLPTNFQLAYDRFETGMGVMKPVHLPPSL